MTQQADPLDRLFNEIEAVGKKVDEAHARYEHVEDRVEKLERTVEGHARELGEVHEALGKCARAATDAAGAAARSANIALDAQKRAGDVIDDATKLVKSAMQIHNASISASVSATVKKEVGPLAEDVKKLKEGYEQIPAALNEVSKSVKGAVGDRRLRALIVLAILVGAGVGGFFAGRDTMRAQPTLIGGPK